MTKIDDLKPKHGEKLVLHCKDKETIDIVKRISANKIEGEAFFTLLCFVSEPGKDIVVCRQCFLDTAMQYEEIGSLMRELADLKK